MALPQSPALALSLTKLRRDADELASRPPASISALFGIEGRAAFAYFTAWQSTPLRWKGTTHRPIPDEWHRIGPRQSANGGKLGKNRRASHPVNAILNYAYAILESQVRIGIIAEGYDPAIGYLHAAAPGRPAFVFDLMEPLRPMIDRRVLEFVQSHAFHPADFTIRSDGVCRLNPEMARYVVKLAGEATDHGMIAKMLDALFSSANATETEAARRKFAKTRALNGVCRTRKRRPIPSLV